MKRKKDNNKSSYILTKETLGMTLLLFCGIVLIMLLTGSAVFAGIGKAICTFMYGTFGYGSILIIAALANLGVWLVFEKRIKLSFKTTLAVCVTAFVLFLLFHAASSRNISLDSYGGYISDCYTNAAEGFAGYTFGGVISAIFVYPFAKLITFIGAYVIFSLLSIACGYWLYTIFRKKKNKVGDGSEDEKNESRPEVTAVPQPIAVETIREMAEEPKEINTVTSRREVIKQEKTQEEINRINSRKILYADSKFDAENYRRNLIFSEDSYFNKPINGDEAYLKSFTNYKNSDPLKDTSNQSYTNSYQDDVLNQPASPKFSNYVYGEKPVDKLEDFNRPSENLYSRMNIEDKRLEEKLNAVVDEPVVKEEKTELREQKTILERPAEEIKREEIKPEPKPIEREQIVRPLPVDKKEEDKQEETDSHKIDMSKLFGSSSLPKENHIEPDLSRLKSRRDERSKNLLDNKEERGRIGFIDKKEDRSRSNLMENKEDKSNVNLLDDDEDDFTPLSRTLGRREATPPAEEKPVIPDRGLGRRETNISPLSEPSRNVQPVEQPKAEEPQTEPVKEEKPKHVWKKYVRPTLDLLDDYPEHNNVNTGEIEDNKQKIMEMLEKYRIESEISNVTIGPAITRYDVVIEDKTKITQALKYRDAMAMALMKDNVTAYLNYSKGAVSLEVPNNKRTVVGLKTMLASQQFINSNPNAVTFALGKTIDGEVKCPDITKMPHLLVAGTTGSGKSICLSSLIISLLYKYGPEELRLILVDPKQVEFISYDKLPHLMINEIIHDIDKAIKALNWAIKEMERRYTLFKEMTEQGKATKSLEEYNRNIDLEKEEKLPKIVIILDEFGDLMLQAKKEIESKIIKLVQKSRACGIHLILATQRPSVDCITGLIKSNLPTRIGFKVGSYQDSGTIFDVGGAEKLLGKGDMYFRTSESPDLLRVQGCFVDTHEVQRVTDYVKAHNEAYFDQSVSDFINTVEADERPSGSSSGDEAGDAGETKIDDTYIKALSFCVTSNHASVAMIQRRFPIGYIKACKIIDWMENMNYVTQSEGSKPRKVLLTREEFINTYGDIDD